MSRTHYNGDITNKDIGKKVILYGWIHEIRDQSKVKFILLRDSTGIIQTIVKANKKDIFEDIVKIPRESVISIEGVVKKEKQAPSGFEIEINKFNVISRADEKLPIQVNEKGPETILNKRLDWRSLDLRKPRNNAIFEIQSTLVEGMIEYLEKNNFKQVFTPCLMGVPSESGSEMFELNYFKTKAFLRQDPQLHRQLTIAGGMEKIFDLGPSWRAELSHTTKHLCEHRTCAPELAFIEDEKDTMKLEEELIVSIIKRVNDKNKKELELLDIKLKVPKTPFPELRFPKIYDLLEKEGKKIRGEDLDAEAEKIIWNYVKKKYKNDFYFFNRFPSDIKPFYVMRVDDDPNYARSVDLNCKGLELSSGGQREHRYDHLMKNIKEANMDLKSIEWFTKFFKFGVPPHGGFALGVERLTQILLDLPNVRESTLFPRDPERLTP